jgi:hypothetical protein
LAKKGMLLEEMSASGELTGWMSDESQLTGCVDAIDIRCIYSIRTLVHVIFIQSLLHE